jgi:hypothetical protein
LESLFNTTLNRSVKPPLISCFAVGIGRVLFDTLSQSCRLRKPPLSVCQNDANEDLVNYELVAKASLFRALSGACWKNFGAAQYIGPYGITYIDSSTLRLPMPSKRRLTVLRQLGLIGDLVNIGHCLGWLT